MPKEKTRRCGGIDIGSNAIRLLIADGVPGDSPDLTERLAVRMPLRLGAAVFANGEIGEEIGLRLEHVMAGFASLARALDTVQLRACATSAFREAGDGVARAAAATAALGAPVEVLNGIEEAKMMARSARLAGLEGKVALIDVGGGSTEISVVEHERTLAVETFRIGTVRLLGGDRLDDEFARMHAWIGETSQQHQPDCLLGSGGNIRFINRMFGGNQTLAAGRLRQLRADLEPMSIEQRIGKYAMRADRADTITGALRIFLSALEAFELDSIAVRPKVGLAEGIVISMLTGENDAGKSL